MLSCALWPGVRRPVTAMDARDWCGALAFAAGAAAAAVTVSRAGADPPWLNELWPTGGG